MALTTTAILMDGPHRGGTLQLHHWPSGGMLWILGVAYIGSAADWQSGREPVRFTAAEVAVESKPG